MNRALAFVRSRAALFALAFLVLSCSASAVQTQATGAQAVALAANRAEPVWIAAYHADGRASADAACPAAQLPATACVNARLAAVARVNAKWQEVAVAWDALREAHGAYAERLDACRGVGDAGAPDAGACGVGLSELAAELITRANAWRCEVRALGRADLDVLNTLGPAQCAAAAGGLTTDGGL